MMTHWPQMSLGNVITRDELRSILSEYNLKDLAIATLASHSALQIAKGAKDEGLRVILIVERSRLELYEEFSNIIDEYVVVDKFGDIGKVVDVLRRENCIFVPHGSAVEYVGPEHFLSLRLPVFGNRMLMVWEGNQHLKMRLLAEAGIEIPRQYSVSEEFEDLVIVKLPGAKGGKHFFLARNSGEVRRRLEEYLKQGIIRSLDEALIQKYIIGVPMYFHYFYSPILGRVEMLGIDIRYETNIDGLRRLPYNPVELGIEPTFVVVGNIPVVIREKMLQKVLEYGKRFVKKSQELLPPGVIGPFCLESIVVDDNTIVVFEFSGRIVAGTNIYVGVGSPYSWLYWNEPMYMGRRIAREIRIAAEQGIEQLFKIVT